MASQQQALILDTLVSLKKAVKRKVYESDSDSSIDHNTNRGNKLKKRARFVRKGHLSAQATGHTTYKEVSEHAGYQRTIISRNAPLVDEEGYEVDSDDDQDRVQEASARRDEDNPYSSIQIEHLLAPLTSVTDLPTHPTLSRPFTSKALAELTSQARALMHKEKAALWKVKRLLTQLQGDSTWAPCGLFVEPDGHELFSDTMRFLDRRPPPLSTPNTAPGLTNGESSRHAGHVEIHETNGHFPDEEGGNRQTRSGNERQADADKGRENGLAMNGVRRDKATLNSVKGKEVMSNAVESDMMKAALTERNGALALIGIGSSRELEHVNVKAHEGAFPHDSSDSPVIHPLFQAPLSARPDGKLGLPPAEAEELRRTVQLFVQRQEETCRGALKLYEGLLKADRLRRTVLEMAKAEAHCGSNRDLSDGEDWYDKEDWGLTEDLKKGQDEEEEETTQQQQQQKKTRNRR